MIIRYYEEACGWKMMTYAWRLLPLSFRFFSLWPWLSTRFLILLYKTLWMTDNCKLRERHNIEVLWNEMMHATTSVLLLVEFLERLRKFRFPVKEKSLHSFYVLRWPCADLTETYPDPCAFFRQPFWYCAHYKRRKAFRYLCYSKSSHFRDVIYLPLKSYHFNNDTGIYLYDRNVLCGLCACVAGPCSLFGQLFAIPCPLRLRSCRWIVFNLCNGNFVRLPRVFSGQCLVMFWPLG